MLGGLVWLTGFVEFLFVSSLFILFDDYGYIFDVGYIGGEGRDYGGFGLGE